MKKILILIVILLLFKIPYAQNISGIINNYAAITNINANVISVSTTAGFNVGDKVMLLKMKGALINQTNTPAYGDTTTMGEAGKYIFSYILAIDNLNNTISLSPFCDVFADSAYMQLVSVPIFPNPVITAPLTCAPWDGFSGGVLIFETPNTLTFNADIVTDNKGYRGGDLWGSTFSCGNTNYFSAQVFFGPEGKKGEGVADWVVGQECGKGKLANGGGGCYSGNTGAGGGANGGKGGDGGFEYDGCVPNPTIFSVGGMSIDHKPTILLMGGGGGAPQSDNGQQVYNGGNGGAIVFIKAASIDGNGFSIKTKGESPPQINDEGAPGGGAGGSVYLDCNTFNGTLNIEAIGGNGSSNNNVIFASNCQGPGGGGGGGLVWFSGPATPPGVNVNLAGGAAGMILNPASPCFNTTYNAQPGVQGVVKYNFVPTPMVVPPVINIGNDTTICANSSLTLDAGAGYTSYLWDDNSTGQSRTINSPGTFYVTVTTPNNCTASDTIKVVLDTSVVAAFTAEIRLGCDNDTVIFTNTSLGSTQFHWIFRDGNYSFLQDPTHIYQNQDTFTVMMIASNPPCADTAYMFLDLRHPIGAVFAATNDTVCVFENIVVTSNSSPAGFITHSYDWGDGTITTTPISSHSYSTPGNYLIVLTITDTLGCIDTMQMPVYVEGIPYVHINNYQTDICVGEPIYFTGTVSSPYISFQWDFGDGIFADNDTSVTHTYDAAGNYVVFLRGNYIVTTCPPGTDKDSVFVTVNAYPQVNLGKDTAICPGLTGSLFLADLNNPTATYLWSTGEVTNGITVSDPGRYWVKASNGTCSTLDSIWIKRDCYLNIPNVFTPDGDGLNDYFLPRELLSSGVSKFKMSIYNRWGEQIFVTEQVDGRGWDGKYNGVPQSMGVFVYIIEVEFINNLKQNYKGNVTLIR